MPPASLKIETERSSELLLKFYHSIWRHNPEDGIDGRFRENAKSASVVVSVVVVAAAASAVVFTHKIHESKYELGEVAVFHEFPSTFVM
jgi:hypothetical protein